MRDLTRKDRHALKQPYSKSFPQIDIAIINLACSENAARIIRSMACFGLPHLHVIGSMPSYNDLRRFSGSTQELVDITQYSNVHEFLSLNKKPWNCLISLELDRRSIDFYSLNIKELLSYRYEKILYIFGAEESGLGEDVLAQSSFIAEVPLLGAAYCLNVATACSIVCAETIRQLTRD